MKNLCLLLLALPVFAGCMSNSKTQPSAQTAASPQTVADKRVIIDPDLQGVARVLSVDTSLGAQGFLRVELQVQNQTTALQTLSYHFDWTDPEGAPIDLVTEPLGLTLEPHETTDLISMAPTPLARNFSVTFAPTR